jgi:hypothetical protein
MRNFTALFKGRDNAHGHYFSLAGRKKTDRGKLVSKAESVHEPVTPALWKAHIDGKSRLGIIPVMSDGNVNWFVLDVDFYENVQHEKIAQAIKDAGLPLVMTRSKSGGAHLWCFLAHPMPAEDAYKIAVKFNAKLGLADILGVDADEYAKHVDIFPKDFSATDIGKWVNIPYFGSECPCLGEDGNTPLSFEDFVKYANKHLAQPTDLNFKASRKAGGRAKVKSGSEAPPCIDFMIANGVEEGHRDMALTHFCVYAKQAFPDEWQDKAREFNEEHINPPLRSDEVNKILNSAGSKDFFYLCKAVKDIYCDKKECKKRTYGVGAGGGDTPDDLGITHLEKIDGEKPIYLVTIDGKIFDVDLDALSSYPAFRKRAMGRLNRMLPSLKQGEWEDVLSDQLEMMEVTEAGADTQMRDRVIKSFQHWCAQSCVTDNFEAAVTALSPFYDGKTILFSGDALLSQLDRQLRVNRDEAYIYMRDWGTTIVERNGHKFWCYVQHGPLWFDPYKGKKK